MPEREGVVDLWKSQRRMAAWQECEFGGVRFREIGDELTVMSLQSDGSELTRWSAPRSWFEEHAKGGRELHCGGVTVDGDAVRAALVHFAKKRPKLVERASKAAAAAQVRLENEKAENGEPSILA